MTENNKKSDIFAIEASTQKGKNIIAVVSGRRGIGKTWFAVSLSHALSQLKQKVLLFDGDCGLNNIKIQLGLADANDLNAVINGQNSLNQVVFNYDKGHFDIAAGNPAEVIRRRFSEEIIEHLLSLRWWDRDIQWITQNLPVLCSGNPEEILTIQ